MSWLPDDVKEASGGEVIDRAAHDAIRLAHRALDRFPELVRKHKVIAGGAAISSSLVVLAGVAITRRILKGESAEDAVRTVTEAELEGTLPGSQERRRNGAGPASAGNANGDARATTPETRHVAAVSHMARRHAATNGAGSAGATADGPRGR